MTLTWSKENSPRWDADKQRIFGPAELAAVGLAEPRPGEPVYHIQADGHAVDVAERDLQGPLRELVIAVLAGGGDLR